MPLPPFVPFPPAKLRKQIDPSEWTAFISAWSSLTRAYTALPEQDFATQVLRQETKAGEFLLSFVRYASQANGRFMETEAEKSLKQSCLALVLRLRKLNLERQLKIVTPSFIEDLCLLYAESPALRDVADDLWRKCRKTSEAEVSAWKHAKIESLTSFSAKAGSKMQDKLIRLVVCVKTSPSIGSFLMEGSDFLDACLAAWKGLEGKDSRRVAVIAFYCLAGLIEDEPKNISLLWDHLYTLKMDYAERKDQKELPSLLEQLLETTPLLEQLEKEDLADHGRGQTTLQAMQKIVETSGLQRFRTPSKSDKKGKGRATDTADEEIYIHKMSLITQVQELFPALEPSRILQLLHEYHDDPESVIAYLLDNPPSPSKPNTHSNPSLQSLPTVSEALTKLLPHPPYISQLPIRKNIYDNEDLATLDPTRLHKGHKTDTPNLQTPSTSTKAAILSALAAFDSDSDERDDTYDIDDVGGTVDTTVGLDKDDNDNEETLYLAWKSTPELFTRDTTTRRSKPRAELKEKTGLTDESIEGWALMLSRDTRQQQRLERRFSVFTGQQSELQSSNWKAPDQTSDYGNDGATGEVLRHATDRGRGGRLRGRGPWRGGQGRGGGANAGDAGGSSGQKIANERRKKDTNKSSRANHNRRDQRARKISRAGFPV
ncbi:MAG: hypothetical protein GOMPHAMPRED_004407 [Gomphillus americanus]|uniref:CUE domain-containing protein n=1 Tax=Gomphillus americanus TaxID=1940652 RepID=A0A8H3FQD5_9LECA|nr:MAG: hypothetical protein GOMPHAMPRED_004407 [Gomphillus americanus]